MAHRGEQRGRPYDLAREGAVAEQPVEQRFDLGRARGKHRFESEASAAVIDASLYGKSKAVKRTGPLTVSRCTSGRAPFIAKVEG